MWIQQIGFKLSRLVCGCQFIPCCIQSITWSPNEIIWPPAPYFWLRMLVEMCLTGWWLGTLFPYIGNNHPNWLIFFKQVGTCWNHHQPVKLCSNWGEKSIVDQVNQPISQFFAHVSRQYEPHGAPKCTRRALPTRAGRAHWASTWTFIESLSC